MVYAAETDPLCYPGTTVLVNLADLRTQDELDEFELAISLTRMDEASPAGRFDYAHYRTLHHHLFQDVYSWAGTPRTIRIGKGGNWFCYPEYIDGEMARIFAELLADNLFQGMPAAEFAVKAAHLLADINAVHPFREGNGRTQLAFLAMLADNAGLPFHHEILDRERVIGAMINSFSGEEAPLATLIAELVADPFV